MDIEQYPPNSHRFKEQQARKAAKSKESDQKKVIKKVVDGPVSVKKNGFRALIDAFISEDAHHIKDHLVYELLIPTAKRTAESFLVEGARILFWGDRGGSGGQGPGGSVSYHDYSSYSKRDYRDDRDYSYRDRDRDYRGKTYDQVELRTRREAITVLDSMDDLIRRYGHVTIGDLNELLGITGEYTDERYGWTSVRGAEIVSTRNGYKILLPKPSPFDRER